MTILNYKIIFFLKQKSHQQRGIDKILNIPYLTGFSNKKIFFRMEEVNLSLYDDFNAAL